MNAVVWSTTKGEVRLHAVAPTWARARERADQAWGRPGETWRDADAALRSIAQRRGALDTEEAEWLLRARAAQVHLHLGMPTFLAYLERVLGHGPRAAQERIRVAEALATQPGLRTELAAGRLAFSAVRELSRVSLPETEVAWIDAATGKTLREIERMVSGRKPGDLPGAPADPALIQHVLHFEVSAETAALFRETLRKLRQDAGSHLSDDEALAQLARAGLAAGGPAPGEPGDAPYQVALTVCATCKKTEMNGGGEPVQVGADVLERALCDAIEIGRIDGPAPARAKRTIPPAIRRQVWHRDGGRCIVPGCRSTIHCEVHHIHFRSDGGGHDPVNLAVLCGACHDRVHKGTLLIRGTAPDGMTFLHGDGRPFGAAPPAPAPPCVDPQRRADAISALVGLRFRKTDAVRAVDIASAHVGADVPLEDLIRHALRAVRRLS